KTLLISEELGAYTLTDVGTYLKYSKEGLVSLEVQVGEGDLLLNVYSAIATSPTVNPDVNFEDAVTFIKFLVSDEGQAIFDGYGSEAYGESLFSSYVDLLREGRAPATVEWIEGYAFIGGSECPPEYRAGRDDLYGEG
ncbi:MAG: tungsten ABC transporter permease, partial [Candidatus Bathyarchaeia archaeon]